MEQMLGVIGGLGPLATIRFMELVLRMTQADAEQDNLDMVVYNFPSVPDRTDFILGASAESPLPKLVGMAKSLEQQGVAQIAVPCVTAHYFYEELRNAVSVPIIHAVAETAWYLCEQGVKRAGVMATRGTIRSGLFERALEDVGIQAVYPTDARQADVTHLIYQNVKLGKQTEMERFARVRQELNERGAEVTVLGCTELSVIKNAEDIGHGFLDVQDVLAQQSVLRCGKKLKEKYRNLIT